MILFSKVGLMYCREGQQTEEDMYNNEDGGPAFNEFLELIGQKVRLKGFNKYKAGLCSKSEFRGQFYKTTLHSKMTNYYFPLVFMHNISTH